MRLGINLFDGLKGIGADGYYREIYISNIVFFRQDLNQAFFLLAAEFPEVGILLIFVEMNHDFIVPKIGPNRQNMAY